MKQVTIENVKKRIFEMERARFNGLAISLNEDFELACLRQLVAVTEQLHAVVAESAGLKEACGGDGSYRNCPACTHSEYIEAPETPATDAAIASLRAEGVEMAIRALVTSDDDDFSDAPNTCAEVARQLRSQSAPSPEAAAIARQFEQVKGAIVSELNYNPADPDKMALPEGKTCGDCAHIRRCKGIYGHTETDTYCDWSPSRAVFAKGHAAEGLS